MYIGNFWREREKASSKVKVLIRRRQRRLQQLELREEMAFVASVDMPMLEAIVVRNATS